MGSLYHATNNSLWILGYLTFSSHFVFLGQIFAPFMALSTTRIRPIDEHACQPNQIYADKTDPRPISPR